MFAYSFRAVVVLAACLSVLGVAAFGAETPGPSFRDLTVSIPKLKKAPVIDGVVDPDEWKDAGMSPRLVVQRDEGDEDRLTDEEGKFWFGCTDDSFYLAFRMQRPASAVVPMATTTKRDAGMWKTNDYLELHLDSIPKIGRPLAHYRDYYFCWNLLGTKYDRVQYPVTSLGWDPEWDVKCRILPGYGWEGEVRWPLKIFEHTPAPKPGDVWRFNLFSNEATPVPRTCFSAFSLLYSSPRDFSYALFTGDDVFVRVLDSGVMAASGKDGVVLEIVNPGAQPSNAAVALKFYKRKAAAPSKVSYLRGFDQARDRPEDLAGKGKVALFIPDEKVSEQFLTENYDVVQERKEEVALTAGGRKLIDFTIPGAPGDYLVIYDVRKPGAASPIAGCPLPFLHPEPLALKTASYVLVDKSVELKADLRYIPGWKGEGKIEVALTGGGRTYFSRERAGVIKEPALTTDINVRDVPPGTYEACVTVKDAAGKVLAERKSSVVLPAMPDWLLKPVGFTPVVPPPWRPIRVNDGPQAKSVDVLMGDYEVAPSALPAQINTRTVYDLKREPILRAPMALQARIAGKDAPWTHSGADITKRSDDAVEYQAESKAGDLVVKSGVTVEYEGMTKVVLNLLPATPKGVVVDELWLDVPIRKQYSQITYGTGAYLLQPEGCKLPFTNILSLGDEERRFCWFAENWRGWRLGAQAAKEAIEILNGPDGATLRLHLIKDAAPFLLDKERRITFGFMFTPARTYDKKVPHVLYYGGDVESEVRECGARGYEFWDYYGGFQGWPEMRPEVDQKMRKEAVAKMHAFGTKFVPYTGWFIHRQSSTYLTFGAEMVNDPVVDGGCGCDTVCWNTPIQDVFVSRMRDRALDCDIDGFRMDAGFVNLFPCHSLKHRGYGSECGWYDDTGKLQPSLSIFAARRAAQRAYRLFHGDVKVDGLCLQASSPGKWPPIFTHMEGAVNAEGPDTRIRTMKELPLEFYRGTGFADTMGLYVLYLPKSEVTGFDSRCGLGLLHNFTIRGVPAMAKYEVSYSRSAQSPAGIWNALDSWLHWYGDPDCRFLGYWKNRDYVDTGSPDVKASVFLRPGKQALLVAMSFERKPIRQTIKVDLKRMGFTIPVFARDAINDEEIALKDGAMELTFTPESYRLIKLATAPVPPSTPAKIGPNLLADLADPANWPANGVPKGWTLGAPKNSTVKGGVSVEDGLIVLKPDMTLVANIPAPKGKTYVLEVTARVDCADGVYLGESVAKDYFSSCLGWYTPHGKRTLASQMLPGQFEVLKSYFKNDEGIVPVRFTLTGQGVARIRHIELCECEPLPYPK